MTVKYKIMSGSQTHPISAWNENRMLGRLTAKLETESCVYSIPGIDDYIPILYIHMFNIFLLYIYIYICACLINIFILYIYIYTCMFNIFILYKYVCIYKYMYMQLYYIRSRVGRGSHSTLVRVDVQLLNYYN